MKPTQTTFITASIVLIEWLEYSLYLYLSYQISQSLLPKDLGSTTLIITFGIFLISYLARPLGALCFGLYSDFKGRKSPLLYSAFFLGLSTICIGLIPSYQSIGILAPILLLGFRLIQSFAISGEFNNAAIFLMEHTPRKKILAGSIIGMASSCGMFLGGLCALLVDLIHTENSWRYLYICIGIITFILMHLRYKLSESPIFINYINEIEKQQSNSFWQLIKENKTSLYKIAVIASFMSVYIYLCNFFFINLLQNTAYYTSTKAMTTIMIVQGLVTLFIPVFALLAEKVNEKNLFRFAVMVICITSLSLFLSAKYQSSNGIIFGFMLYILGNGILSAIVFKLMYDLLPAPIRCTVTSFMWSLSAAIIGSSAPILATYFVIDLDYYLFPAFYILILGILCFFIRFNHTNS
ncbi:MFS transporter [Thiotrichales bacterium 19S11-10]|nr:MFS transporter [Thiotrichales bacterium 19S11-10]